MSARSLSDGAMLDAGLKIRPLHRWACTLLLISGLMGCVSIDGLDVARRKYQATADYASLRTLAGQLKEGMSREETEALLGDAGYSPVDGQHVYGTDREELVEEYGVKWTVYLVLSFRDSRRNVTNELQGWGFHPLGE